MICQNNRIKKIKYCVSDLTHKINLMKRDKEEFSTEVGETDFEFTKIRSVWSGIKTTNGTIWSDGIATNDGASHVFIIRYAANITNELFIEYKDVRYKILDMKNVNENDEWLELRCRKLGLSELEGSEA